MWNVLLMPAWKSVQTVLYMTQVEWDVWCLEHTPAVTRTKEDADAL